MKKIVFVTFLVLLLDQASKIYVKTHFQLGESKAVFPWFHLTFVENPGMAYGFHFGGLFGKYILVALRVLLIGYMLTVFSKIIKQGTSNYFLIPAGMIFAGAIGNLIDGVFYGQLFNSGSLYQADINRWVDYDGISQLTSLGHGYTGYLKGCVVDMLHFTIINWQVPANYPLIGGMHLEFFRYVFNIADASITIGVSILLLFRKKAFPNGVRF